ncbi:RsmB/NOP family class I SAM-dependent RNA methyltransferase [Thermosphaera sp.]
MEEEVLKILKEIFVKPSEKAFELSSKYRVLPYMAERYVRMLGEEEAVELLKSFEKPVKPVIRVNTLLVDPDTLKSSLEAKGFRLERISWFENAFKIQEAPEQPSPGATIEYLKGYYYLHRDSSSLLPVLLLTHEYKGDVLDACAAPGGKTTFLAERVHGKGFVYANDLVLRRLRSLIGHITRMRVESVVVSWSDARKISKVFNRKFERILLDAPCSGEGRISVDPGRRFRTSIYELALMVKREIELLDSLINLLDDDGIIAYSTCSIAPEENEYVVSKILRKRSDVEVAPPPVKLFNYSSWIKKYGDLLFHEELEKCVRLWPHVHGTFGFTTCLLRKTRR